MLTISNENIIIPPGGYINCSNLNMCEEKFKDRLADELEDEDEEELELEEEYRRERQDIILGTLPVVPALEHYQEKEKERNMYDQNTEQTQRNYMTNRARDIRYEKSKKGLVQFGLNNENYETTKQMIEWIKADRYVYDAETDTLRFRDPAIVVDRAAYDEWSKKLDASYQIVRDATVILPVAEALKVLQEFESATIN